MYHFRLLVCHQMDNNTVNVGLEKVQNTGAYPNMINYIKLFHIQIHELS